MRTEWKPGQRRVMRRARRSRSGSQISSPMPGRRLLVGVVLFVAMCEWAHVTKTDPAVGWPALGCFMLLGLSVAFRTQVADALERRRASRAHRKELIAARADLEHTSPVTTGELFQHVCGRLVERGERGYRQVAWSNEAPDPEPRPPWLGLVDADAGQRQSLNRSLNSPPEPLPRGPVSLSCACGSPILREDLSQWRLEDTSWWKTYHSEQGRELRTVAERIGSGYQELTDRVGRDPGSAAIVQSAGNAPLYRAVMASLGEMEKPGGEPRVRASAASARQGVRATTKPGALVRAQLRQNGGLRWRVFDRDGYRCQRCGASGANGAELTVDHIVPVSRGGTNDPSNLRTLCRSCNSRKGARSA